MRASKHVFFLFILLFSVALYAAPTIPPSQILSLDLSTEQLRQAAEAGDPDAQYALGYLYYNGKNVPQNTTTALNWIKRASVQGQEQAIAAIHILAAGKAAAKPAAKKVVVADEQEEENETSASSEEGEAPASVVTAKKPTMPILNAPDSYFTIQLLLSSNKAELDRYILDNNLGNKAHYYPTKKNDYVLLFGAYQTRAEAQAVLANLPTAVKAQKPWIKQIAQVKTNIKNPSKVAADSELGSPPTPFGLRRDSLRY